MRPVYGRSGEQPQLQTLVRYGGGTKAHFVTDDAFGVEGGSRALRAPAQQSGHRWRATVRAGHEAFLDKASDTVACTVEESARVLREVRAASTGCGRHQHWQKEARSSPAQASSRVFVPPPQSQSQAGTDQIRPLDYTRSARDLFAALSTGPQEEPAPPSPPARSASAPRVVSVGELQRGARLVSPAPPLPFEPDGQSPGERRRAVAEAMSATAGLLGLPISGARRPPPPVELADGVSSMLVGSRCDLGEIRTAPTAPCSSFDSLLDRLVDAPDTCFLDPLALFSGLAPKPTFNFNA
mmetsp:Transcript_107303/g.213011  ORF Transcript_107303/g.213011 Transcript_107303/m.213011 type:complete len:297 (-) Transcript_107303:61-951(-)